MISFALGILLAANFAAGKVLNPSSRAEMISVGAAIFPNGKSRRSGALSRFGPPGEISTIIDQPKCKFAGAACVHHDWTGRRVGAWTDQDKRSDPAWVPKSQF